MMYDNIERCCQLHERLEVLYVVDGYRVQLWSGDGCVLGAEVKGETLERALLLLDQALHNCTLESFRKATWSNPLKRQ